MEEEYFLYNNTLYSKGDLSKKYGESVDQKINEFGFEKAYQYNDVVYSSSQLKSKYGDDYESVIETKGITPYGVKKKNKLNSLKKRVLQKIHRLLQSLCKRVEESLI